MDARLISVQEGQTRRSEPLIKAEEFEFGGETVRSLRRWERTRSLFCVRGSAAS